MQYAEKLIVVLIILFLNLNPIIKASIINFQNNILNYLIIHASNMVSSSYI